MSSLCDSRVATQLTFCTLPCLRAQVRYEKSMADRAKNVERLLMDTKLRDDIEIANERPEGSSMSKGGKAEFIEQVKAGTYDE